MKRTIPTIFMLLVLVMGTACGLIGGGNDGPTPVASPAEATPVPPTAGTSGKEAAPPALPTLAEASPTVVQPPIGEHVPIAAVAAVDAQIPDSFIGSDAIFASFSTAAVSVGANVQAPAVAPDLSNVQITVLLSPQQRERIAQNGFVVSPGETKEFYELYERARYDYIPVFVTSDSLLHVYHLLFDKTLRRSETEFFIPMLTRLDWELLNASVAQYDALAGTPWAEAARRNAAYFAVAIKLLVPEWTIPDGLHDLAEPDLAQIEAHQGLAPSAIFPAYPFGEDWSQYVPRGHYTQSEALQRYFKAMMWHGRMTFRVNDPTETQQAALLTLALQQTTVGGRPAQQVWSGIYEPTVFFVGRSDDLTPTEYEEALASAYGPVSDVTALLDEAAFARFQQAAAALRAPEILGMVIMDDMDVEETTKGLRFMGQRFVPDAFVFRQLMHRNVPERMLPRALDFFAALGSEQALQHLAATGDTAMPNYETNMQQLRQLFSGYDEATWTQNLYWTWIYSLRPLLEPAGEGYPQFMRSEAWLDKQLTTALGSWTQLKRDTILYAKQVYVERGAGELPPPEPEPPRGYVEPVPLLYARIAALAQMTMDGLDERGLLAETDRLALEAMADIAGRLQTIASKELRGEALTDEEYEFIRFYGAEIEALTFAADDEGVYSGRGASPAGGEPLQAAVVADVATNPAGEVLEEGVGRVFDIYVAAPIEGRLVLAKGGVFSHYEFRQPISERLTDEAWRAMLDGGQTPPLADWTASFIVAEQAEQALSDTVRQFNSALVEALWFTDLSYVSDYLAGVELQDTRAYIESLQAQGQFVGAQRLSMEFLSFDFQGESNATVTTRERWTDELYSGSPVYGGEEPRKIGVRPPYEVGATYTMEKQGERWVITRIVLEPDFPNWQPQ